jgi:hypothetical protein
VEHLCSFKAEDIHQTVARERGYDIVVYGAVGDVLGDAAQILHALKQTLRRGGYLVVGDAYNEGVPDGKYLTREQWQKKIKEAGFSFIAEKTAVPEQMAAMNQIQQEQIAKRAEELIQTYPEDKELFACYIQSQLEECEELESTLVGVDFILKKE